MSAIASQITSLAIVYSAFYSGVDQGKHQSSASLAFVWGIHRDRWIPRTKGQLRGKCFHLMTSSCETHFAHPVHDPTMVLVSAHHLKTSNVTRKLKSLTKEKIVQRIGRQFIFVYAVDQLHSLSCKLNTVHMQVCVWLMPPLSAFSQNVVTKSAHGWLIILLLEPHICADGLGRHRFR